MDINEQKVEEARYSAQKFAEVSKTIRYLFTVSWRLVGVWLLVSGIVQIIAELPQEGRVAIVAKLFDTSVELFEVAKTSSYFIPFCCCSMMMIVAGIAWWREHLRCNRLVKEKARWQKIAESQDSYRTSSGLTETGDTPRRG